jgi:threonine/homoserine/homoserine lactone efflux protein
MFISASVNLEVSMPDSTSLTIFITAALALLLVPSPAVLYIVARSIEQGRVAGFISTLGIGLGSVVHVVFAALGLSTLLMKSALAFSIVKYFGAAYLVYLGIRTLATKREASSIENDEKVKLSRIFSQGFIVNLLNPKTAIFFFAFLPQFVSPERGPIAMQIIVLGIIFVVLAIMSDGLYAFFAGSAREFMTGNPLIARFQKYFAGIIYITLGLTTALSGNSKNK